MVTIESFVLKCGEKLWCFKGHFQLGNDVDSTWELSNRFVHSKMIIPSSFSHPHVATNLYDVLLSEHDRRYSEVCAGQTCLCNYNARMFKLWKRTQKHHEHHKVDDQWAILFVRETEHLCHNVLTIVTGLNHWVWCYKLFWFVNK